MKTESGGIVLYILNPGTRLASFMSRALYLLKNNCQYVNVLVFLDKECLVSLGHNIYYHFTGLFLASSRPSYSLTDMYFQLILHAVQCYVAGEAVCCLLSGAKALVPFQIRLCGIYGGQCGMGNVFLRVLRFPLLIFFPTYRFSVISPLTSDNIYARF